MTREGTSETAPGQKPELSMAERIEAMHARLVPVGYYFDGGPSKEDPSRVSLTFFLLPNVREVSCKDGAEQLGLYDEAGELLPGWELPPKTKSDDGFGNQLQLGFTGDLEEAETKVEPLVRLAQPDVE